MINVKGSHQFCLNLYSLKQLHLCYLRIRRMQEFVNFNLLRLIKRFFDYFFLIFCIFIEWCSLWCYGKYVLLFERINWIFQVWLFSLNIIISLKLILIITFSCFAADIEAVGTVVGIEAADTVVVVASFVVSLLFTLLWQQVSWEYRIYRNRLWTES